jgi:hypothetical protein
MTLSHSIPAAMTASLPIIPLEIRRYHATLHPTDSRFAAAARLLQALWREERGWPMGTLDTPVGPLPLGSRLRDDYARAGANFLSRKVAERVRLELAYRRPGALYDERRVWANLLASQPLAFNLLVPLQLDPGLATAFFRRLLPDLGLDTVLEIGFEHTPGRRDPRFLRPPPRTWTNSRSLPASTRIRSTRPCAPAAYGSSGGSTCSPGCSAGRATTRAASCYSPPG